METRHSSPARSRSRPPTQRKRSNSLPIVDALGCSEAEANLIMAEGRAAIRRRQPSVHKAHPRRHRSVNHGITTFRPQDHMQYLNLDSTAVIEEDVNFDLEKPGSSGSSHSRTPSNYTDNSTSTITGPDKSSVPNSPTMRASPSSPLDDYSANLAKFIKSQLNSIPTYNNTHPLTYPHSCPDLSLQAKTPPASPKANRTPVEKPHILEIPPIRPPLRSAFSEWSSTDDETDSEVPPLPSQNKESKGSGYTPSILGYYQNTNGSSFLLSSTPPEDEPLGQSTDGFVWEPGLSSGSKPHSQPSLSTDDDYLSSTSARPTLAVSSVPSMSSASTASYFDYRRPLSVSPDIRNRIIAAVSPHHGKPKIIPAISPFEGADISSVHDVLVESQNRLVVDGLSFDLVRDFKMPEEGIRAVSTPC